MDFEKKEQTAGALLPAPPEGGAAVTCVKFSPQSLHLACGRANGEVWILEPVVLTPKAPTPFACSDCAVQHLQFSGDALQFACSDANRTVHLFNYHPQEDCWRFRGKVRSHYEPIHDLGFFPTACGRSSLLSIGADRHLVEYNNMEARGGSEIAFAISSRERIEQSAVPTNFAYYERGGGAHPVGYLLLANDQHKIKTLHAGTKLPRSLVLGPALGCFHHANLRKMRVLPQHHARYLVFITEKYLGMQLLPADGNPFKYCGYLAHPHQVGDFALSHDGGFAFTYGAEDRSLLQWEVRPRAVELLSLIGGTELEPFYCLLEGGKSGWLFQEVQDLFFYMQILQQENIDLPRRVSDTIQLSEIPELVRTCGFYPSHFELETMMMDIRYRDFDETGLVRDEVSFVEFVRLFVNHRPAYGYSMERLREAFGTMCQMGEYPKRSRIEKEDFVYLLQSIGEPSPNLHRSLTTLLRVSTYGENNFDFLPPEIDSSFLVDELLGIDAAPREKPAKQESSESLLGKPH
ncbi:cilia- and flagella-associated protein 251 isoform X1 [Dendroctonus ponderosae]|uniref:cilia- and flagella-associated protein 251 isoform X1 n=1 Tax=Dendroctonus ponderosae TaxID=77166 RepID=UPI002036630D|nr:cilia- and flagella-associated protein 251 isoform X1 [Dendroctonus ponderosae]